MKRILSIGLLTILLFVGLMAFPSGNARAEDGVVRILFLYSPDCADCIEMLQSDIPTILKQFGSQVEFLSLNISQPGNERIYKALTDQYKLTGKPLPIVFIGEQVLAGKDEVRAGLQSSIQQAQSTGGTDYPFGKKPVDTTDYKMVLIISGCMFLALALVLGIGCEQYYQS